MGRLVESALLELIPQRQVAALNVKSVQLIPFQRILEVRNALLVLLAQHLQQAHRSAYLAQPESMLIMTVLVLAAPLANIPRPQPPCVLAAHKVNMQQLLVPLRAKVALLGNLKTPRDHLAVMHARQVNMLLQALRRAHIAP